MGYRKILGGDLTKEIFDSLSVEEKERLIFDLANFLHEMHGAISVEEAKGMGVKDEDLDSYSRLIKSAFEGGGCAYGFLPSV